MNVILLNIILFLTDYIFFFTRQFTTIPTHMAATSDYFLNSNWHQETEILNNHFDNIYKKSLLKIYNRKILVLT